MALTSHYPDDHTPWPELSDLLCAAVEQVRRSQPPPAAVDRSLARARQIGRSGPSFWTGRGIQLFATVAAASTLLFVMGSRHGAHPPGGNLARTHREKISKSEQASLQGVAGSVKDEEKARESELTSVHGLIQVSTGGTNSAKR